MQNNTNRIPTALAVGAFAWLLSGHPATALPLPLLDTIPVAGESDQGSFNTSGNLLQVDWMVAQAPSSYYYLYQIENPLGNTANVTTFTVFFNTALAELGTPAYFSGSDLDAGVGILAMPPHYDGYFANLTGELNDGLPVDSTGWDAVVNPGDVTWTYRGAGLAPGHQSVALYFVAEFLPVYGDSLESDSVPPSPWGSLAPDGQQVPVPNVPDGGSTVTLLGLALVGVESLRRSMRT